IEIAVLSFAYWDFSRYILAVTWIFVLFFVPTFRMLTKKCLNFFGLWKRETIIIGDGNNAVEAWKAINSESNLGFNVTSFVSSTSKDHLKNHINDIPVISLNPKEVTKHFDKRTQFIVALETSESSIRNDWLREFLINGFRYVSVIPTLRGVPLDSTDMSFIFSHEVMIFRVQQNLAKLSSRILKRLFDIIGSLTIILVSSPLLIYIALKVKKDHGP
ncbi:TPA: UDP-phosphate galactose phosphotransferase, partial [Klebsiella pneumoniae]|nr:UDP-phosphate galactose phosphotransferase [Klebsiella pneumoniae]